MKKWVYILILFFASVQCRDAYNVTPATNGDGVLVIEGVLNANCKTTINLSKSTTLFDKMISPVIGSLLFIEAENGTILLPRKRIHRRTDNIILIIGCVLPVVWCIDL